MTTVMAAEEKGMIQVDLLNPHLQIIGTRYINLDKKHYTTVSLFKKIKNLLRSIFYELDQPVQANFIEKLSNPVSFFTNRYLIDDFLDPKMNLSKISFIHDIYTISLKKT